MKRGGNKKGVVWVSTILYVLISITIIGILMAAVRPKVAELKDEFIISQTIESLNTFDDLVGSVQAATGTRLKYELSLNKGSFTIKGNENLSRSRDGIVWMSDSKHVYSEVDKNVLVGRINALTTEKSGVHTVTLDLEFEDVNLTVNGLDQNRTLTAASTPYIIWVENKGKSGNKINIDISVL